MISVIVPVYNADKYLKDCIDSILNQTYSNVEIILIDDGSKDSSGAICDEYKCRYDNVSVIHQQNQGVSAARNAGLKIAKGELITFVDSDDTLDSDMYEILINAMETYKADISHCGYKRIHNGDVKLVSGTGKVYPQSCNEALHCLLTGKLYVGGLWNKLYKRKVVNNLSFITELKNNEDILYNFNAFYNADKTVFIDEPKYNYIVRDESSACSNMNAVKREADACIVSKKLYDIVKNTELKNEAADKYLNSLCGCFFEYANNNLSDKVKETINEIKKLRKELKNISRNTKIKIFLISYFPHIYIKLYSSYEKHRTPNWDVNV